MATTINVLCYKYKTLSNGEHPIMVRICKDGKKKYVSVGISVKAKHWNFDKNGPKPNCPNGTNKSVLSRQNQLHIVIFVNFVVWILRKS